MSVPPPLLLPLLLVYSSADLVVVCSWTCSCQVRVYEATAPMLDYAMEHARAAVPPMGPPQGMEQGGSAADSTTSAPASAISPARGAVISLPAALASPAGARRRLAQDAGYASLWSGAVPPTSPAIPSDASASAADQSSNPAARRRSASQSVFGNNGTATSAAGGAAGGTAAGATGVANSSLHGSSGGELLGSDEWASGFKLLWCTHLLHRCSITGLALTCRDKQQPSLPTLGLRIATSKLTLRVGPGALRSLVGMAHAWEGQLSALKSSSDSGTASTQAPPPPPPRTTTAATAAGGGSDGATASASAAPQFRTTNRRRRMSALRKYMPRHYCCCVRVESRSPGCDFAVEHSGGDGGGQSGRSLQQQAEACRTRVD